MPTWLIHDVDDIFASTAALLQAKLGIRKNEPKKEAGTAAAAASAAAHTRRLAKATTSNMVPALLVPWLAPLSHCLHFRTRFETRN